MHKIVLNFLLILLHIDILSESLPRGDKITMGYNNLNVPSPIFTTVQNVNINHNKRYKESFLLNYKGHFEILLFPYQNNFDRVKINEIHLIS